MKRGGSEMYRIRNVLAMKNAPLYIALCEYRYLIRYLKLFERSDQIQVAAPMRLLHSLDLPVNKY